MSVLFSSTAIIVIHMKHFLTFLFASSAFILGGAQQSFANPVATLITRIPSTADQFVEPIAVNSSGIVTGRISYPNHPFIYTSGTQAQYLDSIIGDATPFAIGEDNAIQYAFEKISDGCFSLSFGAASPQSISCPRGVTFSSAASAVMLGDGRYVMLHGSTLKTGRTLLLYRANKKIKTFQITKRSSALHGLDFNAATALSSNIVLLYQNQRYQYDSPYIYNLRTQKLSRIRGLTATERRANLVKGVDQAGNILIRSKAGQYILLQHVGNGSYRRSVLELSDSIRAFDPTLSKEGDIITHGGASNGASEITDTEASRPQLVLKDETSGQYVLVPVFSVIVDAGNRAGAGIINYTLKGRFAGKYVLATIGNISYPTPGGQTTPGTQAYLLQVQ